MAVMPSEDDGWKDPAVPRSEPDPLVEQDVEVVSVRVVAKLEEGAAFTWRPGYQTPEKGTIVSLATSAGFSLQVDLASALPAWDTLVPNIEQWLVISLPYLAMHDETYLGVWVSLNTRRLYLDVNERYVEHDYAIRLGKERNQESVFRLDDMSTHDTGGTGK
jgi:hypothetical protein